MKRLAILCSGDVPAFESKRLETNQIPGKNDNLEINQISRQQFARRNLFHVE